jgi:UDP-glucose 4-epimerase
MGEDVAVVDDLSSGDADGLPPGVELVTMDIADPETVDRVRGLRPDLVVHAAAQVSVVRSVEDPERDRAVNVLGTGHVLSGSRDTARRFVFISSGGAIYGEAELAGEDDLPRPLSPYGESKLAAERLVAASGMPYAIARLSNVYGPGQRAGLEGGVVAVFIERIREGSDLVIYGDGEQRRDLVHVRDVTRAVADMARSERSGTWNVGTGTATSVNELADLLTADAPGIGRTHRPARRGEIRQSSLRVDLAATELGWTPAIGLREGLRDLLTGARPPSPTTQGP